MAATRKMSLPRYDPTTSLICPLDDAIGKPCQFDPFYWDAAITDCCSTLDGMVVPQGKSQAATAYQQMDGRYMWCKSFSLHFDFVSLCLRVIDFTGNVRNDRKGHLTVNYNDCMKYLASYLCDGYGRWKATSWDTYFVS